MLLLPLFAVLCVSIVSLILNAIAAGIFAVLGTWTYLMFRLLACWDVVAGVLGCR